MLKKHMAVCLIATAFTAPAFAQGAPTSSGTDPSALSPNGSQFMTQVQPDQFMASKLIGTKVVSASNESIGDINDVIVDHNGQAVAAVVGVGGFLGMGEKNVAIPFSSLDFASRNQANNVTTTGSTNTTGSTGSANTAGATGSSSSFTSSIWNSSDNTPARVILHMSKEELQAAPTFNSKSQ